MKQIALQYKTGDLSVLDVPVPTCRPGGVLVRSLYSLISTGTEMMKVTEANLSLVGKARARPDQVHKLVEAISRQGLRATYSKAMSQLSSYTPLGYSMAGVVIEVGSGAEEFKVGQLVACAGNEYALHAEVDWVPVNLCVPVSGGVDARHAAFATVGAIAMHGVRRAEPQLGETACVVGLGLVGQIAVQLLVAAGVRVFGVDTITERCRLAERLGATACDVPDEQGTARVEQAIREATHGLGADHIFLVAGGSSNGPVELAARLARDRARVVDIGKVKLDLPWNTYYDKELDVRFSRSYGPGRYDDSYELEGIDYPAGYVRWTERRNLQCFVDLLADGKLDLDPLISGIVEVSEAADVYRRLKSGELTGVGHLFSYPEVDADDLGIGLDLVRAKPTIDVAETRLAVATREVTEPGTRAPVAVGTSRPVRVGFIGAGNYASSMLLPHLSSAKNLELTRVVTATSLSAANAQRKFGFKAASTDIDDVLGDDAIDVVFVVTRHHLHAELVCRALEAGKTTFVEKPLALTDDELARIAAVVESTGNDRLMVGFNRRFSRGLREFRAQVDVESGGSVLRYTVNAGQLDSSSWYNNTTLEGSRFAGEGGHFIDTVSWWLKAAPVSVHAVSTGARGDVHVVLAYEDGSMASVDYLVNGSTRVPKEVMEVTAGGRTARFENFQRSVVWSGRRPVVHKIRGGIDKGQATQLEEFLAAVRTGAPMPISLASLTATTAATIAASRSLALARPVRL
jgi:predicted dehydrogenase/threonine dehydrogenase-like Zn-dependent dehydrogenase